MSNDPIKGVPGNVWGLNWVCIIVEHFLGFIWDIWNVSTMYNQWVWVQSRRSKLFKLFNNDDKKYCKNS